MIAKRRQSKPAGFSAFLIFLAVTGSVFGQSDFPKAFQDYLKPNQNYVAERVTVVLPEEINQFIKLFEEAAARNPEWYAEYSKTAKPSLPFPYHENLNLTPEQYQEYLDLWGKREMKVVEKMQLRSEERDGKWRILVSGSAGIAISLLRYDEESDSFRSTSGTLKRIEDIDVSAENLLGAWEGVEWRFTEETPLGRTKENLALGKMDDGKHGIIIYRLQDVSSTNRVLLDQSVVLRFLRD
jgi:hypothetical protein